MDEYDADVDVDDDEDEEELIDDVAFVVERRTTDGTRSRSHACMPDDFDPVLASYFMRHFGVDGSWDADEIVDGIFLGGCTAAADAAALAQRRIDVVVNVTDDIEVGGGVESLRIEVDDAHDGNLLPALVTAADFIHARHSAGHRVLVHCRAGVSRSTTTLATYLLRHRREEAGASFDDAVAFIRRRRAFVCPNHSFRVQLEALVAADFDVDAAARSADVVEFLDGLATPRVTHTRADGRVLTIHL